MSAGALIGVYNNTLPECTVMSNMRLPLPRVLEQWVLPARHLRERESSAGPDACLVLIRSLMNFCRKRAAHFPRMRKRAIK